MNPILCPLVLDYKTCNISKTNTIPGFHRKEKKGKSGLHSFDDCVYKN